MARHEYTIEERRIKLKKLRKDDLLQMILEAERIMLEARGTLDTINPFEIDDYFEKHYPKRKGSSATRK